MNSFNRRKSLRIFKTAFLLFEVAFVFGFSVVQNSDDRCCHPNKEKQKKSCCMDEEPPQIFDHCNSVPDSGNLSFTNCNCVHDSKASSQDVTISKIFELTKFDYVMFVGLETASTNAQILFVNKFTSDKINGPPIFIKASCLLI